MKYRGFKEGRIKIKSLEFWLEFILDEELLKSDKIKKLKNEAHQLASIFISSRMTAQGKPKKM